MKGKWLTRRGAFQRQGIAILEISRSSVRKKGLADNCAPRYDVCRYADIADSCAPDPDSCAPEPDNCAPVYAIVYHCIVSHAIGNRRGFTELRIPGPCKVGEES